MSWIERVVMIYILYCLVPVIDQLAFNNILKGKGALYVWLGMTFVILMWFFSKFVPQYKESVDREPPQQAKISGERGAPDTDWVMAETEEQKEERLNANK